VATGPAGNVVDVAKAAGHGRIYVRRMGFLAPDPLPFDPAEFRTRPRQARLRKLIDMWANDGISVPGVVIVLYVLKILLLHVGLGLTIIGLVSGLGAPWTVGDWWNEPIVWQKVIVWTVLLEVVGMGGASGPLWGQYRFRPEALLAWTRTGTFRCRPWRNVPFTAGDRRTPFDVAAYVALLASLVALMVVDGSPTDDLAAVLPGAEAGLLPPWLLLVPVALLAVIGLRDKLIFLAARSEQYVPALLIFAIFHGDVVDMIIAAKILIVVVWVGAGLSKVGVHFGHVIPVMVSNTPWVRSRRIKRSYYRDYPDDMRPSRVAGLLAHVGGSAVEIGTPLLLLFTMNETVAIISLVGIVGMHVFILSTVPMAVPLEWNVVFIFLAFFLFAEHGSWEGFALYDISSPWIAIGIGAVLLAGPIIGNIRPDRVSFLVSMRQYSGNWATGMFAFAPGAELKLDREFDKVAPTQLVQLAKEYGEDTAYVMLDQLIAMRAMHSQGRAQLSLMQRHLGEDYESYDLREGEMLANPLTGWTFGDAHLYDERLMTAIQEQCDFAPGELLQVCIESQPVTRFRQDYRVVDAARGVIERGWYDPREASETQPWLPDGPITLHVEWSADGVPQARPWSSGEGGPKAEDGATPVSDVQPA